MPNSHLSTSRSGVPEATPNKGNALTFIGSGQYQTQLQEDSSIDRVLFVLKLAISLLKVIESRSVTPFVITRRVHQPLISPLTLSPSLFEGRSIGNT